MPSMKMILFALSILTMIQCSKFEQASTKVGIPTNYTGEGVTPKMAKIYIDRITYSGQIDYDSIPQHLENVAMGLQMQFPGWLYSVAVLTEDQTYSAWYGYSTAETWVNWKGPNKRRPQWTYFIWGIQNTENRTVDRIESYTRGPGITPDKFNQIESIIVEAEKGSNSCTCSAASTISSKLLSLDGQEWSIACRPYSSNLMYGEVVNRKKQYLITSPNNAKCEYLLVVN